MGFLRWAWREPLVHFLVIGAALFALFYLLNDESGWQGERDDLVVITSDDISRLSALYQKKWMRPPNREELEGLVEEYIKKEIYYREALHLGLDKDDAVVRRRLRQKVEFLTADLLALPAATDEELQAYLDKNQEKFKKAPELSFRQIYFRSGSARSMEIAENALEIIRADPSGTKGLEAGDPSLLPQVIELSNPQQIDSQFGIGFGQRLMNASADGWSGPVESTLGLHLIYILEVRVPGPPTLDEIKDEVQLEWSYFKRMELEDQFFLELKNRYHIEVAWPEG